MLYSITHLSRLILNSRNEIKYEIYRTVLSHKLHIKNRDVKKLINYYLKKVIKLLQIMCN